MTKFNPASFTGRSLGKLCASLSAAVLMCAAGGPARAQFPDHPIRLIVGSNTGGGGDTTARIVAEALSRKLGASIVVENRPGASGNIGAAYVAHADPDGYTLLLAYTGHVSNPALFKSMPFDTVKDFRAVGKIGDNQSVLLVNSKVPARTMKEFIELVRKQPDHYSFGAMLGSDQYMSGRWLERAQGLRFLVIPYKGNAGAMNDVLGGQVDFMANTVGVSAPFVTSGKVRALAVMGAKRSSLLPEVPTLAEAGVQGAAGGGWYALMAPAATPDATIAKLTEAMKSVLAEASVQADLRRLGVEPNYVAPGEFDAFIAKEVPRVQKFAAEIGIKPE
jgi:tripartite-type tricarboxylate transporter receptor subunit TctC